MRYKATDINHRCRHAQIDFLARVSPRWEFKSALLDLTVLFGYAHAFVNEGLDILDFAVIWYENVRFMDRHGCRSPVWIIKSHSKLKYLYNIGWPWGRYRNILPEMLTILPESKTRAIGILLASRSHSPGNNNIIALLVTKRVEYMI